MGLSKSKESYDVSSLQTKIAEENAYGSIRKEGPNLYSQFGKDERDIDVINKGETRKDKIIRFGPERRKSIPIRDRAPSNTPVNEADEEILKEIVEKVKSGGAVVVSKSESGEEERRCSIDENPVAPIEQLIEDFERKSRKDSIKRRGSYLGRIYAGENETKEVNPITSSDLEDNSNGLKPEKDPLEKVEEAKFDAPQFHGPEKNVEVQEDDSNGIKKTQSDKDPLEETEEAKFDAPQFHDPKNNVEAQEDNLNGTKKTKSEKDPLEEVEEARFVAPQRRVSYRNKAEFFAEDVPRKDSIETQPLGHRQSIKENLIEEFNANLHNIGANRTDFVYSMLEAAANASTQETNKKDPLDVEEKSVFEPQHVISERKKSDPLDDNSFNEIQQIMNRDFEKVKPLNETVSYIEYSSTTITDYPLNVVDTQKPKSSYELKGEKQIPLNFIREIKKDATKLRKTVEEFEGRKDDVHYVYLNEMLLRCLIKLDSVNVGDDDVLKQERRNVVDYVQDCIHLLDSRAEGDDPDIEVAF